MRIRLLRDPSLVTVRRRCDSSDKRVGLGTISVHYQRALSALTKRTSQGTVYLTR